MITLYKFGRLGNLVDPSPPCLKVDSYLRMAGLEYQTVDGVDGLRKAPKGKLPYIEDNGAVIPDSTFILHYLKDKYGDSVDGHLDDEEKATTHAFMKMMDENLYWGVVHSRWMLEENWPKLKRIFFGGIPALLREFIAPRVRKKVRSSLYGHGIGRHSDAEIAELCAWDLKALSDFLGEKVWFHGEKASSLDACAYGVLAQLFLQEEFTGPLYEKAKSFDNLVSFTQRFHRTYYES